MEFFSNVNTILIADPFLERVCIIYWIALIIDINILDCVLQVTLFASLSTTVTKEKTLPIQHTSFIVLFFGDHKLVVLAPCGVHATLKELVMLQS